MIPRDPIIAARLRAGLLAFDGSVMQLPGIQPPGFLDCLIAQMVDSIRRIKYVEFVRNKRLSGIYADPISGFFDPVKGAAWHHQRGDVEEAFWLVFLFTHFGKNKKTGWRLAQEVYRGDINTGLHTWNYVANNFAAFQQWLQANQQRLRDSGHFGNHRKYQSLDAFSSTGTGVAIGSYIEWIQAAGGHMALISGIMLQEGNDPKRSFHALYRSMQQVVSFGRTARFDYLTMVGKLGLASIEPDSTYMTGATGPKDGANLLFVGPGRGTLPTNELEANLNRLEFHLGLPFGMQILEDSLCNWQKSPSQYRYFGG